MTTEIRTTPAERVAAWLDDDEALRIPDTDWGRQLYADLRTLLDALSRSTEWWISDGDANRGGEKLLGPFATRDLALEVRALYEASHRANGQTFWVSEVPTSAGGVS